MSTRAETTQVHVSRLNTGQFFVEHPDFPGVWGLGTNRDAAIEDFVDAVRDWVRLG